MLSFLWPLALLLFSINSAGFINLNINVKPASLFPVILIVLLLLIAQSQRLKILKSREIKVFILFILYIIFSGIFFYTTTSEFDFSLYLKGLLSIFIGFLFYITFRFMNINDKEITNSERLILLSISVSIFIAFLQFLSSRFLQFFYPLLNNINIFFTGSELLSDYRFNGLSPEPAWLAEQIILIALPLSLSRILSNTTYGFALNFNGRRLITIEFLFFMVSLLGISIAGSRTGIYGTFIVIFLALLINLKSNKFISFLTLTIMSISFFSLYYAFQNQYNLITIQSLLSANSFGEYSQSSYFGPRASLFLSSFEIFKDNLIFGIGLNQFGSHYPDYVQQWALSEPEVINWISLENANPKNFLLRLLSETGLIGTSLFLYFIFLHFKKSWNLRYRLLKYCTLAGLICFFFEGDSFALPNLWFALGFLIQIL